MDIGQLKEGNIIVVYPRENQQGILAVREIQPGSIICDMLSPRAGYQFRIRFNEANPVPLSNDWLLKASFRRDPEEHERWLSPGDGLPFHFSGNTGTFADAAGQTVTYLHQLQNTYCSLTGRELHVALN